MQVKYEAVKLKDLPFNCPWEVVNGKRIYWEVFQVDAEPGTGTAWIWMRLND